jgi:hypothetical protein
MAFRVFYQQFHELSKKYRNVSVFKQSGDLKAIATEIIADAIGNDKLDLLLFGKTKLFGKDKIGRLLDVSLAEW